jgi:hypothetical protein
MEKLKNEAKKRDASGVCSCEWKPSATGCQESDWAPKNSLNKTALNKNAEVSLPPDCGSPMLGVLNGW